MRILPDMNDLCNFQDTCLLHGIVERRFETCIKCMDTIIGGAIPLAL